MYQFLHPVQILFQFSLIQRNPLLILSISAQWPSLTYPPSNSRPSLSSWLHLLTSSSSARVFRFIRFHAFCIRFSSNFYSWSFFPWNMLMMMIINFQKIWKLRGIHPYRNMFAFLFINTLKFSAVDKNVMSVEGQFFNNC